MSRIVVALLFVALNFYIYSYLATDEVIPERTSFESFPMEIEGWKCRDPQQMTPEILENLGATDYLMCDFRGDDPKEIVNVYIGYHETQIRKEGGGAKENSIHPPEHCLPGSGWDVIEAAVIPIDFEGLPGGTGEAKRFVIAKGNARQLVYFWYQSRGRAIARNHDVILYRFLDRAMRQRTDGSLVRLTVPIWQEDEAGAEAELDRFASEFVPKLDGYIPN